MRIIVLHYSPYPLFFHFVRFAKATRPSKAGKFVINGESERATLFIRGECRIVARLPVIIRSMREERRGKFARKTPSTDYFYALCPPLFPLASPFPLSQTRITGGRESMWSCSSVITGRSFAKSKVTSATPSFSFPVLL